MYAKTSAALVGSAIFTLTLVGAASLTLAPLGAEAQTARDFGGNVSPRSIQPDEGGEDLFNRLRGHNRDTPLAAVDMFSPAQVRELRSMRIVTAEDLLKADAAALGRVMGTSAREMSVFQTKLRQSLTEKPR